MSRPQPSTEARTGRRIYANSKLLHAQIIGQRKTRLFHLFSHLKGPAAELLQKVPPDSQNTYAELVIALELQYGDKHL